VCAFALNSREQLLTRGTQNAQNPKNATIRSTSTANDSRTVDGYVVNVWIGMYRLIAVNI